MSLANPKTVLLQTPVALNVFSSGNVHLHSAYSQYESLFIAGQLSFDAMEANVIRVGGSIRSKADSSRKRLGAQAIFCSGVIELENYDLDVDLLHCPGRISLVNCTGHIGTVRCGGIFETDITTFASADLVECAGSCTIRGVSQINVLRSRGSVELRLASHVTDFNGQTLLLRDTATATDVVINQGLLTVIDAATVLASLRVNFGAVDWTSNNTEGPSRIEVWLGGINYQGNVAGVSLRAYRDSSSVTVGGTAVVPEVISLGVARLSDSAVVNQISAAGPVTVAPGALILAGTIGSAVNESDVPIPSIPNVTIQPGFVPAVAIPPEPPVSPLPNAGDVHWSFTYVHIPPPGDENSSTAVY